MRVLFFGSGFIEGDNAFKYLKDVAQSIGIECKVGEVEDIKDQDIVVDMVEGLSEVRLIELEELSKENSVTTHDYDLGMEIRLKVMSGMLKEVYIVGLPMGKDFNTDTLVKILKSIVKGGMENDD